MFLSAARREANSPGSRVGFFSKSWISMVGFEASLSALWSLWLLRKPILFNSLSCVKWTLFGVFDGTLVCGRGVGKIMSLSWVLIGGWEWLEVSDGGVEVSAVGVVDSMMSDCGVSSSGKDGGTFGRITLLALP